MFSQLGIDPATALQAGWALFFATWLHEDLALITATVLILDNVIAPGLAAAWLYGGMLVSDIAIYSAGRLARRHPWFRRKFIGPGVERAGEWLHRNLVRVVAICRMSPGVLFPTYIACGWFGIRFHRFFWVTALSAGIYLAVVLPLAILLGDNFIHQFGYWAWGLVGALLIFWSVRRKKHPAWKMVARATDFDFRHHLAALRPHGWNAHLGMPSLANLRRYVARAEHIPPPLFYIPVGLHWFGLAARHRCLTLPALANPRIEGGGYWGESKSACLRQIAPDQQRWVAPFITVTRGPAAGLEAQAAQAADDLRAAGLDFPLVAKPDIGWQGYGVRMLGHADELRGYLAAYPEGAAFLLQKLVPYDGEAGVFYVRQPGAERGEVVSLTLRYYPCVTGDGRRTLRALILADDRAGFKADNYLGGSPLHSGMSGDHLDTVPREGERVRLAFIGSLRVGGLYRDGRAHITPALVERFDAIARSMPEFHFGRFDIRFASVEKLEAGEDFFIFEINGAGSEMIHIWDPEKSLGEVYRTLFDTQRRLFAVGAANRARGFRPPSVREFLRLSREQQRLIKRYPPSI